MSSPDPSAALNDTSLTAIHSCGSTYIVYQDASLHLHAHCVEGDIEHSGGDVWPTPPKARELTPLAFLQWGSGSEYNIASGLAPQISLADGLTCLFFVNHDDTLNSTCSWTYSQRIGYTQSNITIQIPQGSRGLSVTPVDNYGLEALLLIERDNGTVLAAKGNLEIRNETDIWHGDMLMNIRADRYEAPVVNATWKWSDFFDPLHDAAEKPIRGPFAAVRLNDSSKGTGADRTVAMVFYCPDDPPHLIIIQYNTD
ncbi:MAG: hypothetical protein MMC23_002021 [Stictis urceolatum]|nr:hypothetical protein [Stictis urceolata]